MCRRRLSTSFLLENYPNLASTAARSIPDGQTGRGLRGSNKPPLTLLHRLVVLTLLSAAARLANGFL